MKGFIQEENIYFNYYDFEYYFMTEDNDGNIIEMEITNDDQPVPLLEGIIEVETVRKETKVHYHIIDRNKRILTDYMGFYGTIPISLKKPKTLEAVKKSIPDHVQKFLKNGKSVKYFFQNDFVRKELFQDSEEVPVIQLEDGRKMIQCWIMISSDLSEKFYYRQNFFWNLVTCIGFLLCIIMNVMICIFWYYDSKGKPGPYAKGEGYLIVFLDFMAVFLSRLIALAGATAFAGGFLFCFFISIESFLKKLWLK